MELTVANDENSFDSTPNLKSSPVPISFISFSREESKCNYCGNGQFSSNSSKIL